MYKCEQQFNNLKEPFFHKEVLSAQMKGYMLKIVHGTISSPKTFIFNSVCSDSQSSSRDCMFRYS